MIYICLFYANFCSSDRLIASARDILLHLLIMEVLAFFNFGKLPILNLFDQFWLFFSPGCWFSSLPEDELLLIDPMLLDIGYWEHSDTSDFLECLTVRLISQSSSLKYLAKLSKEALSLMVPQRKETTFLKSLSLGTASMLASYWQDARSLAQRATLLLNSIPQRMETWRWVPAEAVRRAGGLGRGLQG